MKATHPIQAARELPPRVRLVALQAALRQCDASERRALLVEAAELAIEDSRRTRNHIADEALATCLELWPELDGPSRRLLRAFGARRLHAGAAALARSDDARARLAGVSFAADALDEGEIAGLETLTNALGEPLTSLGDLAERALMRAVLKTHDEIVNKVRTLPDDEASGPELRDAVRAAIARAVASYETHKRRGVLMGGLLVLGGPGVGGPARADVLATLRDAASPAGAALRTVLRASGSPLMREVAWRALPHDEIGAAALDRVARASTREEHEAVLNTMHLVLHPRRRARAALLSPRPGTGGAGLVPPLAMVPSLAPEGRAGLLRALDATDCDAAARTSLRTHFLTDPSPHVRALATLSAGPDELMDFAFDAEAVIARRGMWQGSVAGAGWQRGAAEAVPRRPLKALLRSPHDAVRRAAQDELDRLDPHAGRSQPSLALSTLARHHPSRARDLLAASIGAADPDARVRTAAWAGRLPIEAFPLDAMLAAARGDDLRLAATALLALAWSNEEPARQTLLEGLSHPDARVRANAVEALARRHRSAEGTGAQAQSAPAALLDGAVWELRRDPGARARANALRAWTACDPGDAGSELLRMLHDPRPDHRLSAAWCAGRTLASPGRGPVDTQLHARLVDLGRTDPDEAVRARSRLATSRARSARSFQPSEGR